MRRTWRWRTGCSTPPATATCSCTSTPRSPTPPGPVTDGKWRAPDSLGYNEHIGAVAAIVSQHLEEALTARFGLAWEARDDGHGFEIKGISGQMMRLFSSRRESITADLRARAAQFEQQYGRTPSQRELARLAQASNFKTRAPPSTARWTSRRCTRAGRTSSRAPSA